MKKIIWLFCCMAISFIHGQIRGDTCVAEMNTINEDLTNLVKKIEDFTHSQSMDKIETGQLLIKKKKYEKAEFMFQQAIELYQHCYQGYGYIGVLNGLKGDLKKAADFFEKSLEEFKNHKDLLIMQKDKKLEEFENELCVLTKRLENLSSKSVLIDGVGTSYQTQNKLMDIRQVQEEVGRIKESLTNINELNFPPFFRLKYGNVLFRLSDLKGARNQYEKGMMNDSESGELSANMAACCLLQGDQEGAIKHYLKAKKLNSPMSKAFIHDMEKLIRGTK